MIIGEVHMIRCIHMWRKLTDHIIIWIRGGIEMNTGVEDGRTATRILEEGIKEEREVG